mmetsp:Transcript_6882/g.17136  ORF Transcript_6882/g.17136 Transcript_6882/m.17136 type:complete len:656 (-) Transcript_6882:490-2457(-)|eukprot:CAMPEP_0202859226 /NCGR_PEP_ID=MMETSP1391-20130828/1437_1 /ASSEMBLY_ACC=CAM_ASM_000867 /TAXON_ID=1034604 /ORGANISM="Chlamydomonas leiostraca, Strain SAG 11-49" /LENGTH=655 /DNA_ID=CAMNT_0049538245 /DNA_START=224 /DNA_END=2191 /DNA_ORIENTATION=-
MWEILKSFRPKDKQAGGGGSGGASSESPSALRLRKASVNFKDLNISADDEDDERDTGGDAASASPATTSVATSPRVPPRTRLQRNKLIIIMVGLPGRGKTFLCNKLVCYLNWLGHSTRLFNVGSYRRLQKHSGEVQDATFFDRNNPHGMEARQRALLAALDDLTTWLNSDAGQVAIFDATNTTHERRQFLVAKFHGNYQYMFIESICTDEKILEQNYRYKMRYSPDYQGMGEERALADFKARITKYEEVYEPLEDRTRHYIKLIDMVTGRGHMDINRISGYIPGKIVFFLMQVCKAGMAQQRKIWLTRHGESLYNLEGRIGGDSSLAPRGEMYSRALPNLLIDRLPLTADDTPIPVSVWTSTLKRTIQTAAYLPFPKLRWKALDEIHAGSCDGLTYEQIHQDHPDEFAARAADKLRYRYPAGESYLDVIQRLEPVIIELEREKECVCVVAHQAVLRALYGYFTSAKLADIPTLEIPLHTLIELLPRPDGTMQVDLVPMRVDNSPGQQPTSTIVLPAMDGHPAAQKTPPQVPYGATQATGLSGASSLASTIRRGLFPSGGSEGGRDGQGGSSGEGACGDACVPAAPVAPGARPLVVATDLPPAAYQACGSEGAAAPEPSLATDSERTTPHALGGQSPAVMSPPGSHAPSGGGALPL